MFSRQLALLATLVVGVFLFAFSPAADARPADSPQSTDPVSIVLLQEFDEEVPPGNPVLGDDRPGDIEPENETTRYLLWGVVAVLLVAAGVLLIKIERWESRRNTDGND